MALANYIQEQKLARAGSSRQALLMTHVVCGYPSFDDNWQELEIMQAAGVELVELQFPFSEPSADGPLFVKANQAAYRKRQVELLTQLIEDLKELETPQE